MEESDQDSNRNCRESRGKRFTRFDLESYEREKDRNRYKERDPEKFRDKDYEYQIKRKWIMDSKEKKTFKIFRESSYYSKNNYSKKDDIDLLEEKYSDEESSDEFESSQQMPNFNSNFVENGEIPNSTLMIRGLAQHIDENDIRQDIIQCGLMPKDIRLIRKKDTGSSRGFAFVEFNTIQEAAKWMEIKKGVLMFHDQFRAIIHYSIPKENLNEKPHVKPTYDWYCVKCGGHNFKRRDSCFKCQASRQESEEGGEGSDEICFHPTKTLLIRSLDVLTTEESIKYALNTSDYQSVIPKSIRIGQDSLTNTSRGICYVEMQSVLDAMKLANIIKEKPLVIDGRKLLLSYCKTEYPTPLWKPLSNGELGSHFVAQDIPRLSEYCASLYASTIEELQSYQQYYETYFKTQLVQDGIITIPNQRQNENTNLASVTLAHNAIQQGNLAKTVCDIKSNIVPQNPSGSDPDFITYQYDKSSGYYYDSETGLYYDPNSQYYYNPHTKQFLYWDSGKQIYNQINSDQTNIQNIDKEDKKGKEKLNKQNKVKIAKKIAKDMEKWAKTLNQKKECSKLNINQSTSSQEISKSLGAADAGYTILERKEQATSSNQFGIENYTSAVINSSSQSSTLINPYESDEEIEEVPHEEKYMDWTKLACLLCKRQFSSKDCLIRHQQFSELHQQNLEKWYKDRGLDPQKYQKFNKIYRDRAKERREKFGEPEEISPDRLKEKYLKVKREEFTKSSFETKNDCIGNKLLKKMGWKEGMGLGKLNQGRTTTIETNKKTDTAGLGSRKSCYDPLPGETYKDCVKKMTFARYQELS